MKDNMSKGLIVAVFFVVLIMVYLAAITFLPITKEGAEFAKTILPYFLGCIGTLFGYYWGSSSKGQNQTPPVVDKNDTDKPV